jgi:transposase-like protein
MSRPLLKCPHCQNDRLDMVEHLYAQKFFCMICSKTFEVTDDPIRTGKDCGEGTEKKTTEPES